MIRAFSSFQGSLAGLPWARLQTGPVAFSHRAVLSRFSSSQVGVERLPRAMAALRAAWGFFPSVSQCGTSSRPP